MEKVFYMIHRTGTYWTSVRHATLEEALTEAKRLAGKNPGGEFCVLKAVCKVQAKVEVEITTIPGEGQYNALVPSGGWIIVPTEK